MSQKVTLPPRLGIQLAIATCQDGSIGLVLLTYCALPPALAAPTDRLRTFYPNPLLTPI